MTHKSPTSYSFFQSWLRRDHGSTSVEFAMVGLGFILLMVGVIEFGRYAWTSNVIDYAVDSAARYAILHQDADVSEVEEHAKATLNDFFVPAEALTINVFNTTSGGVDFVEINGNYRFVSMTNSLLPDSLSLINMEVNGRRPIYADPAAGGEG